MSNTSRAAAAAWTRRHLGAALLFASLLPASASTAAAQQLAAQVDDVQGGPAAPASLDVRPKVGPIHVDGRLDDAGWAGARVVTGFTEFQPGHMARPSVRTEAMLTHDDEYLYVGIHAYDDPTTIRASLRERDEMFNDDWVGIGLDTYGDASWGYLLIANPYGVQGDTRLSNDGDDERFDVVFESAGRITDDGYIVELAIPFSSLRFPDSGARNWRVTFVRNHPRSAHEQISWPSLDTDDPCVLCQLAPLTGLEDVKPTAGLELLPSLVASESGSLRDGGDPSAGFSNGGVDASVSLGARYPFASGWSAEATYNPDFSQVESDAAQVDVNTTLALSFPERRPFFQEGADLFDTWINAVYTRSINDPQVAGRVTGIAGSTNIAWVGAYDEHSPVILPFAEKSGFVEAGRSVSNIVRVRHDLGDGGHLGLLGTDRRFDIGGSGSTMGFDAQYRLNRAYSVKVQVVASHTQEPDSAALTADLNGETFDGGRHTADFDGESYWGRSTYLGIDRSARNWNWGVEYQDATPTFRASNGFVASNGYRQVTGGTSYSVYPESHTVVQIQPGMYFGRVWFTDGAPKDGWIVPMLYLSLARQTSVNVSHMTSEEHFRGVDLGPFNRWSASVNTNFSSAISFGAGVDQGEWVARREDVPLVGHGYALSAWGTFKPIDRLVIEPELAYQELNRPDDSRIFGGYIARTKLQLQFNRELSLRLVTQYDNFNKAASVEPLLMYRLNPFSIFYIGSTDRFQDYDQPYGFTHTDRQFFLKFQYLLRE